VSEPVWAVVVAAGRGARFGRPKQYEGLAGRRVLDWSIAAAAAACDGVVLVVPPERADDAEPVDAVVPGAETRSGSVRAGLAAVPTDAAVIAVHDAARPLVTPALFAAAVGAVRDGAVGAVCAVPVTDTVKRTTDGSRVAETLDRRRLVAVQTPQAFAAGALRAAHAGDPEATDDAALVEAAGGRVVVVPGDPYNLKITNPEDLVVAAALLERRR
jgi:2-C-methyl-D-erythritol 4-phosphate cytidylyltransferase